MGNVVPKTTAREAPARFVAKQLPRPPKDVEEEFAKAKLTIQGINQMKEKVSTTPQPYVETKKTEDSTKMTDMTPPRWYMNTWLELMDNTRQDRQIISGAMPNAWFRDHHEPYSLVRNRIDDEDLDWLLSEGKKMPIEELVNHTKLEREVLEDILATVESPKKQYRNYQGKIHKAIENTNTFMADRAKRMEENRNEELLRQIGYTDEELEDEKQYMTERSRGVKTLDDLGVSLRRKKRLDKFSEKNDMDILLEERKLQAIEEGKYEPSEEEMQRPEVAGVPKGQYYKARFSGMKNMIRLDLGKTEREDKTRTQIVDWLERRKTIDYGKDHYRDDLEENLHPTYHESLSQSEQQAKDQLDDNAAKGMMLNRASGGKKYADPRQQYDTMLNIMRKSDQSRDGVIGPDGKPKQIIIEDDPADVARSKEDQNREAMEGAAGAKRAGYTPRAERKLGAKKTYAATPGGPSVSDPEPSSSGSTSSSSSASAEKEKQAGSTFGGSDVSSSAMFQRNKKRPVAMREGLKDPRFQAIATRRELNLDEDGFGSASSPSSSSNTDSKTGSDDKKGGKKKK